MKAKTRGKAKVIKAKSATKKASKAAKAVRGSKARVKSKSADMALSAKAIGQKQSKSEIYATIAQDVQLSKQDVKNVFSAIRNLIACHVKPKGSGQIILPELGIKVRRIQKKASKA